MAARANQERSRKFDLAVNRLQGAVLFFEHGKYLGIPDRVFQQVIIPHEYRQVVDHIVAGYPDQKVEFGIGKPKGFGCLAG